MAFIVICGVVIANHYGILSAGMIRLPGDGGSRVTVSQWFAAAKPYCNPVEVEMRLAQVPPPRTPEGSAYAAACLALAGQIDRAHSIIQSLGREDRSMAADVVFKIGQPVVDSGDDKSAAPILHLVLEFSPDNVLALFYAGMSEFQQGEYGPAKKHLQRFIDLYPTEDTLRMNAMETLSRLP